MTLALEPFERDHLVSCVSLIARAMNADEGRWAKTAAEFHLRCRDLGIDDGRRYWVYREAGHARGVVGLHHYSWGPPENVWLAWFAVEPARQGQGLGTRLITAVEAEASRMGYQKLFIETYASETFEVARNFYENRGYRRAGCIDDYLSGGTAMVVFMRRLGPGQG